MINKYYYHVFYNHEKGFGSCYYRKPLKTRGQIESFEKELSEIHKKDCVLSHFTRLNW